MAIDKSDFEFVRDLVRANAGIVLEDGKEYLVEARMTGMIRQEKLASVAALVARLRAHPGDPLLQKVVEAMTTNETSFFRDVHPFDALKKAVLPALLARRAATRSLSIWCAASSTGQEPYTIAMTLCEAVPALESWKLNFLATDISSEMVARSRAGTYNQIEINRGLPAALMVKYFEKHGLEWRAKQRLRDMVQFREMNLTQAWPAMPPADIVFMRNVLIYFDANTKREILMKLRRVLQPDGYLFLGCAETTLCLDDAYERLQVEKSGCYQLRRPAAVRAA